MDLQFTISGDKILLILYTPQKCRICINCLIQVKMDIPITKKYKYIRKAAIIMKQNEITIRKWNLADLPSLIQIWNEVVEGGRAFPQLDTLNQETGLSFFSSQYTAVAETVDGTIVGLYILHPNNIGRVGHIANASYAVNSKCRGLHIGELLVRDCLEQAKLQGYRILQFNAVVASNIHAFHLYQRLGFQDLGIIPGGFKNIDGEYEDIHVMYHVL